MQVHRCQARKEIREKVLKHFQGDWSSKEVLFVDDSCETHADACSKAVELFGKLASRTLAEPAENKWLSIHPMCQGCGFMLSFHQIFLSAIREAACVTTDEMEEAIAANDEDANAEIGKLSDDAWHKMQRRRSLRALAWAEKATTPTVIALATFLCDPIMHVHHALFEYEQKARSGDEPGMIWMALDAQSPIQGLLQTSRDLATSWSGWQQLEHVLGRKMESQPVAIQTLAKESASLIAGPALQWGGDIMPQSRT